MSNWIRIERSRDWIVSFSARIISIRSLQVLVMTPMKLYNFLIYDIMEKNCFYSAIILSQLSFFIYIAKRTEIKKDEMLLNKLFLFPHSSQSYILLPSYQSVSCQFYLLERRMWRICWAMLTAQLSSYFPCLSREN